MKTLIDIVNVNADASCLPSARWIKILTGGSRSEFFQWLNLYVEHKKKITLGLTGATIVDVLKFNPESIKLINENPGIFEIILRPFSHDIPLLRSAEGFEKNILAGRTIIEKEFNNVALFFLPPEFMLTNEQITILNSKNIQSVFISAFRFPDEIKNRIPQDPYKVQGICGARLGCIPVDGDLTYDYLDALHFYRPDIWNKSINDKKRERIFSWRDGESPFLVPNGLKRERFWLNKESKKIQRKHLTGLNLGYLSHEQLPEEAFKSYPVHPFSAWMEGLRMLGFLKRIQRIEEKIHTLSKEQVILWLHVIGSDILSAVEKRSPIIKIKVRPNQKERRPFIIPRSERGFEGEEYLYLLEQSMKVRKIPEYIFSSQEAHLIKLKNKVDYFRTLSI